MHHKRRLHQIELREHRGEHCIEDQRERRSHLSTSYEPLENNVDVEALRDRFPLRRSAEKGPKMGSHKSRSLQRWKSIFCVSSSIGGIFEDL